MHNCGHKDIVTADYEVVWIILWWFFGHPAMWQITYSPELRGVVSMALRQNNDLFQSEAGYNLHSVIK